MNTVEVNDTLFTLESLQDYPQWVCALRPDKTPINPKTGNNAMSNIPHTWASHSLAYEQWQREPERLMGIGFMLVKEQNITCVDLDDCIDEDGKLTPGARRIVDVLNSYTEYSPSRRGLHIWTRGEIPKLIGPDPAGQIKVEMYDCGHYMTITGEHLEDTPTTIEDRQGEILILHMQVTKQRELAAAAARAAKQKDKGQAATQEPVESTTGDTRYGLKVLRDECQLLASTSEGGRNDQLNRSAFAVFRSVAGGKLTPETAKRELTQAALAIGLTDFEIQKTLNSAFKAGKEAPRSASDQVTQTPPVLTIIGEELQQALSNKDINKILENIAEIAAFDEITLARFKIALRTIFGSTFAMKEFEELLRAKKRLIEEQKRAHPTVKSAYELMQRTFEQKEMVVPDILHVGLIALAGKQKIGKSWLDYNLCLAVGGGGMAFGSIPVQTGDVLYMALEDNEQRLQDRFKQLLGPGEVMPSRIDYVTEFPRMDAVGVAALEAWIQSKENPRLIIIDPWVKVKPRVKARQGETGYDADYEALEGIKRLADTYKVCILVQFHLRKAGAEDPFDELNGTSGITACADGFLSLKRARGNADATLWGTGRDYKEDVDLALSFNNGYWKILGNAKEYTLSKESKEVIEVLEQSNGPLSPKELATLLHLSDNTMRKRLFNMKNRNEVDTTREGKYILSTLLSTTAAERERVDSKKGTFANYGNGGNAGNGGNGVPNQAQSVTTSAERYHQSKKPVTLINQDVEPDDMGSVTGVTTVTTLVGVSAEMQKEVQQLLSEVQAVFKKRAGIRQMWRDDMNPTRQFLPPAYIARVNEALVSGDPQGIQSAITAMKYTLGKLTPGRDRDA
jgi:hypothetical protein